MHPVPARRAFAGVDRIPHHHVDRHAVAPRIVERHRGVLQADSAVRQNQHRLAFDLGIAIRHGDRCFFMHACMPIDLEIINQRLVQAAKAIARIAGNVLDAETLDDIRHVVRPAGALDDGHVGQAAALHG